MPLGVKQHIGQNNWSPVRGNCAQEGHRYLARPNNDMDTNGTTARDKSNQNFSDFLYHGTKTKRDY